MEQVEKFGELCQQELGITPIQFHIHRDEGHFDSATKEWKPNLHAHIVFDCTCREHRLVERPARFNEKEMKRIDVLSSVKKTITSVLEKSADGIGVSERVKELEQQVADGQAKLDTVIKDSYSKTEVSRMLKEKDKEIQTLKKTSDSTINTMQKEINHLKSENRRLLSSLYDAAKILLTRLAFEAISIFERVGLPEVLGQRYGVGLKTLKRQGKIRGRRMGED